jgi:hypothetical protein
MDKEIVLLLGVFLVCGSITDIEGGSPSGNIIIPRNPFYNFFFTASCTQGTVNVTYPVNGSILYWTMPSVTTDLNFTITGGRGPYVCFYKINDNAWNAVPCGVGSNYVSAVTWPEGYPVVVTVLVQDVCGNYWNFSEFNVVYRQGANPGEELVLVILACFSLLYLLWRYRRRKRQSTEASRNQRPLTVVNGGVYSGS